MTDADESAAILELDGYLGDRMRTPSKTKQFGRYRRALRALASRASSAPSPTPRCDAQKANDDEREWLCDKPRGHDGNHHATRVRTCDGETGPWGVAWGDDGSAPSHHETKCDARLRHRGPGPGPAAAVEDELPEDGR
jgi:hypothetical protein